MHIKKINKRFGVVVDSNKDSAKKPIGQIRPPSLSTGRENALGLVRSSSFFGRGK
jgi:hypothetical protein